jgi:hypothetical protein
MSLAVAAMQLCVVQSLSGQIQAKVLDSAVDPRDLEGGPLPVVIIYSALGRRRVQGMEFFDSRHLVDLVLDFGVAHKATRTFTDGTAQEVVEFQATDAGYDALLQTMEYECGKILFASNDPWPDLFRRFVFSFAKEEETDWSRGQLAEGGRQALLRQVYRIDILGDPVPGAPLPALWSDLLTAMSADAELVEMAKYWRALIASPTLPEWRREQAQLGLSLSDMFALGPAPLVVGPNEPPAPNVGISGVDEASTVAGTVDQATIIEDGGPAVVIAE